jgi:hypothetical protein
MSYTDETQEKPLKCYRVEGEGCESDEIEILFARSSIEAKRRWANEHDWPADVLAGISATRQKHWDRYAPGPVPALEMIEAGWYFECHGCGVQIKDDDIGHPVGWDDDDWDMAREYGPDISRGIMRPHETRPQAIWCNRQCHDDDMLERRRKAIMAGRVRAVLRRRILARFPDAEITRDHVYVTRTQGYLLVHQARMSFLLPGMKHGAELYSDDEDWRYARNVPGHWGSRRQEPIAKRTRKVEWMVANGDREVMEARIAADHSKAGQPATMEHAT